MGGGCMCKLINNELGPRLVGDKYLVHPSY
jgi:hypothetical protein